MGLNNYIIGLRRPPSCREIQIGNFIRHDFTGHNLGGFCYLCDFENIVFTGSLVNADSTGNWSAIMYICEWRTW